MICRVEIARDRSALRTVRIGDHAEHEFLLEVRARERAHESTGHDVARDGEEDHMVAGRDTGHQRQAHAAVAGALR